MKILLLMKRFSTNRDMILENFGRETRLFSEIRKLGHIVTILCADQVKKERKTTKLNGMNVEIYPLGITSILKFAAAATTMAAENEVVVGSTHPLLGYMAHLAAKRAGRKMVYDIRDNYEAYNFTNLPLLKKGILPRMINNHVIRSCDLAVCVGESLQQKIARIRGNKPTTVVPNGVNTKFFRPLNKALCRKKLDLPPKAKIIVYTGHMSRERGADRLIEAFRIIQKDNPDAVLLLSGQVDKGINASQRGIIYKELPRRKDVVIAINAADVAVVPHIDTEATRYGTPYKLMEYMACNVPVVATAIGDVKDLLRGYPESLAEPGNVEDMTYKIDAALNSKKKVKYGRIVAEYTWEKLARKLNTELVKLR